jgi:outer membrane beta-barrel protein
MIKWIRFAFPAALLLATSGAFADIQAPASHAEEEGDSTEEGGDGGGESAPAGDSSTEAEPAKAEARKDEETPKEDAGGKKKRLVKVIQRKFFIKYGRFELTPTFGYIDNDHFVRRISVGLGATVHINDLFSIEILAHYLPNLGDADYKELTDAFRNGSEVVPDINRPVFLGVANLGFAPIYGKVELGTLRVINYDIYLSGGAGVVYSEDDTEIVDSACKEYSPSEADAHPEAGCQYVHQVHPVTDFGGGLRVVFNSWIGVKLDFRQFTHIEQVYRENEGEIALEMKQNFMISIGASFFFPPEPRRAGE